MNPLTWMRDNQQKMLVVFTVMLMAGFGAMGVLSNNMSNQPVANPIDAKPVVEWREGTFTDTQLDQVWQKRLAVQLYAQQLLLETRKIDANWQPTEALMLGNVSSADAPLQTRRVESFNTLLLAQKAKDLNIAVSDDTIDTKLDRFTGALLSRNDMRAIATEVGRRMGSMSYADFREALKSEFLAMQTYVIGVENGIPRSSNPAMAMQYYNRMNRAIECQTLALPVSDYMAKISTTPSETDLKKLFQEGRYIFANYDSSKPGFKIGNRVKMQYFSADTAMLTKKYEAELTDELIQKEYDRLVVAKDPLVFQAALPEFDVDALGLPPIPGFGDLAPKDPGPATDAANSDLPPALPGTEKTDAEKTDAEKTDAEKTDVEKAEMEKAGSEGAGGESTSGEQSTGPVAGSLGDKPADPVDPIKAAEKSEPETDLPPTPKKDDGSGQQGQSVRQLMKRHYVNVSSVGLPGSAYLIQDGEPAEQEVEALTQQATQDIASEAAAAVQETIAELNAVAPGTQAVTPPVEIPADAAEKSTNVATIRPLEEVRDEIKSSLARPKAFAEMERTFQAISKLLSGFRTDYRLHEASPETEPVAKPLDYQAIAKKYGLNFVETQVMDQKMFSQTQMGKISNGQGNLAQMLFSNFGEVSAFEPQNITDDVMFWVSEKFSAQVPTFDQVKDEIVEYWKMNQAVEMALADAKAKAKTAVQAGKPLKESFEKATETGSFTWLTNDFMTRSIRFSNVVGVLNPGEDFMWEAFALQTQQAAAALNADRTVAYVIYKTADAGQSADKLQQDFLASMATFKDYPFQVASVYREREFQAGIKFIQGIREEYDVKFLE